MPTKQTLDETLKTLTEYAPKLRAAGVRAFTVDPKGLVTAELDPHIAAPARATHDEPEEARSLDPLDDSDTFGGKLPGFDPPSDDEDR